MTRAFVEREAAPVSHDAPCTICGAEGGPICDDCATICARAAAASAPTPGHAKTRTSGTSVRPARSAPSAIRS